MNPFRKKRDPYYQFIASLRNQEIPIVHLNDGDALDLRPNRTWPLFFNPKTDVLFRYLCPSAEWSCEMVICPDGKIKPRDRTNLWNLNIRPYLKIQDEEYQSPSFSHKQQSQPAARFQR